MSILIKNGMDMPKHCGECGIDWCYIWRRAETPIEKRPPDCPLVEIPPHGRLIDADALEADLKRQCKEVFRTDAVSPDDYWITRNQAYNENLWKTWCESFYDYLKTRPTIIPADDKDINVPNKEEGE